MHYEGNIIRPPSEANSILLQVTVGCSRNKCTFCGAYQGERFKIKSDDIILADIELDGKVRKVLMQAPKNGFFFVLDRVTGELISAENFVPVNWATHIDPDTGRPVETPDARYDETLAAKKMVPGPAGSHNWHPMSFNPATGYVYFAAQEIPWTYAADGNFDDPEITAKATAAFIEYSSYVTEVIEDRRSSPQDDLISILVGAKDDGKLLFRWGSMVKKPTDIRFQKTIDLPDSYLDRLLDSPFTHHFFTESSQQLPMVKTHVFRGSDAFRVLRIGTLRGFGAAGSDAGVDGITNGHQDDQHQAGEKNQEHQWRFRPQIGD